MKFSLILAAGGSGQRFEKSLKKKKQRYPGFSRSSSAYPSKLFYPLAGKPVLIRTLETFLTFSEITEVLVVVPKEIRAQMTHLLQGYASKKLKVMGGGKTRAESVWNGLKASDRAVDWVLVHDAARPLIERDVIRRLIAWAKRTKQNSCITAKRVVPTIKEVNSKNKIVRTVDRRVLAEAETPQLVRRTALMRAYRQNKQAFSATDEAMLMESIGENPEVLIHETWNPKITTPEDFLMAEKMIQNQSSCMRMGFGSDTHRLVAGRKFYLGGICIPAPFGPLGHSDGDALLHAVVDGILGAMGSGDIGEWFSDRDKKYKNMKSSKFVLDVRDHLRQSGWGIGNLDCVVHLEEPKLGAYKTKMKTSIARLLQIAESKINIKAKTFEGLGEGGKAEAVKCETIVTLVQGGAS